MADATVEDGTNLPSEKTTTDVPSENSFNFDDEKHGSFLSHGRAFGQYSNMSELLEGHKKLQDKLSQMGTDASTAQREAELSKTKSEFMETNANAILDNNFSVSEEIELKAKELDISVDALKLQAYELRDNRAKMVEAVGGDENFTRLGTWINENGKADDIRNNKDYYAMIGAMTVMNSEGKPSIQEVETPTPDRIRGDAPRQSTGLQPYGSRKEMMADKAYLMTPAGEKDMTAQAKYQKRLSISPDSLFS